MTTHSTQHLIRCLIEKQKYKQTSHYIKELQLQNQTIYGYINDALYNILSSTSHPSTSKLFALRFFKDIFMTAQFHLIDGLNDAIIKQIVKASQFDKDNKDKMKRGASYFQKVQKRKKQNDLEKVSYSYVLFATEIIYVMGNWYELDQNQEKTDYFLIYDKLKNSGVPFPENDKELKFFKPEQRQVFTKNLKQWIAKLPEIEEQSENEQNEKQNQIKAEQIQSQKVQREQSKKLLSEKNINKNETNLVSSFKVNIKEDQKENKKLVQINQNLKEEKSKLQTELNSERIKKIEFERKIKQLEQQSSQKQNEFTQKIQKLKGQNDKLQNDILQLKKDKKQSQKNNQFKLDAVNKANQNQQKQIEKLKIQLQRKKNQLIEIKKKDKYSNDQIPIHLLGYNVEIQKKTNQKSVKELSKEKDQMKLQINAFQLQVNLLKKEVDRLKIQNLSLNEKNEQISKKYQQSTEKLKEVNIIKKIYIDRLKEQNENKIIEFKKQQQESFQRRTSLKKKTVQIKEQSKPVIIYQNCDSPSFSAAKQSSMSEYLKQKIVKQQDFLKESLKNNFFNEQSQIKNNRFQSLIENTKEDLERSKQNIKIKNNSLGKTQCSMNKMKYRIDRESTGKSCHFSTNQQQPNFKNKVEAIKFNTFHKKAQTSSYTNLINYASNSSPMNFLSKKSSMLHLNMKESHNFQKINTVIPEIKDYFEINSEYMTNKDSFLFRTLCLKPHKRESYPIFFDNILQLKLLPSKNMNNYVIEINNISNNTIKLRIIGCHNEFKITGDKTRYIQSNSTVEYRIQTKVKDLNLRYPIISFIVYEQNKFNKNNIKEKQYNIPLPLTLLQFTEFKEEISQNYYSQNYQYKNYRSEYFYLNPKHQSLMRCFKQLRFESKTLNTSSDGFMINSEISWFGTLGHSFIQNVKVITRLSQVGSRVLIQFSFREYDKISQNYAKVMIQVLIFLLK